MGMLTLQKVGDIVIINFNDVKEVRIAGQSRIQQHTIDDRYVPDSKDLSEGRSGEPGPARRDVDIDGSGGIHPGGRPVEHRFADTGTFRTTVESEDTDPSVTITVPIKSLAALILSLEQNSFGYSLLGITAAYTIGQITRSLETAHPQWRKLWPSRQK